MLKSVRLKNFKLHEDRIIDAALITVFIGPNNSGKSSIFQALLALKQAAAWGARGLIPTPHEESPPHSTPMSAGRGGERGAANDQILDLGEFKDVVRDAEIHLSIGCTGTVHSPKPSLRHVPVDLSFDINIRDNRVAWHEGSFKCRCGQFAWKHSVGSPQQGGYGLQYEGATLRLAALDTFQLVGRAGSDLPANSPLEKQAEIAEVFDYLGRAPVMLLSSLHPIYPLRGFEQSGFPLPPSPTGSLERPTLSDRTSAIASRLAYDSRLLEQVSERLEGLLGLRIERDLLPGPRVTIRATPASNGKSKTLFANEGTGANQLPFILVPIALTPPNETVLLSEPEAHLHPKGQSELTGMLIEIAKKESLQFFIETHSEHVLHRLLHAVANGDLKREELAIYYFENKSGVAKVNPLKVDERGGVEGGLPGFYDQSLTELTDYLGALRKK